VNEPTTKLDWIKEAVIQRYQNEQYTVAQIRDWVKEEYGLHVALGTVTRALDNWKVKREDEKHKKHYPINHEALDNWSDPQVQYWLKFLVENGAVGKDVVIISTHPRDLPKLQELKTFLGWSKPVEPPKDRRIRLRIYSESIRQQVLKAKQQLTSV
jgi:hypothetical protein